MDLDAIPKKYRKMYARAMTGRSKTAAIVCHCTMCMGWTGSLVPGCTAPDCPLYPYRLTAERAGELRPKGGETDLEGDESEDWGCDAPEDAGAA